MPASLQLQNAVLGMLFNETPFTMPTIWYVMLHTGDPGVECANNQWAIERKVCTSWETVVSGATANSAEVVWLNCPDPGASAVMSWASVWDSLTGGMPLHYIQLTTALTVRMGDVLRLPVGSLVVNNVLPTDLGTVTGAVTVSLATASVVKMTLSGDVSMSSGWTAPATAAWRTLVMTQDATGGRQVTWPTTLLGATPLLNPVASAVTVVQLFYDGTYWHAWE